MKETDKSLPNPQLPGTSRAMPTKWRVYSQSDDLVGLSIPFILPAVRAQACTDRSSTRNRWNTVTELPDLYTARLRTGRGQG